MRYSIAFAGLVAAASAGVTTITAVDEVTITSCAPTHTNCPYKSQTHEWEAWPTSEPAATADPADPDHTWAPWDPTEPSSSSTPVVASSTHTWAEWDPAKPTTPVAASSSETWAEWDPSKSTATPVASSATWGEWGSGSASTPVASSTATAECPQYTATAPPAWFSQLPSSVLSSLAAQWTGAPPADWCYYSYSAGVVTQTKTPVAATGAPGAPAATGVAGVEAGHDGAAAGVGAAAGSGTGVQGVAATGSAPVAKYTGAANANAASFVLGGAAAIAAVVLA